MTRRKMFVAYALAMLAVFGPAFFAPGCASLGGARHAATVSVVTAHSTLAAIQDTELLLVCGRAGSPNAPLCVPEPSHRQISAKLATAFKLDADIAKLVRATPPGALTPAQVPELVGQVAKLIQDIMELIPRSPQKASLESRLAAK